MDEYYEYLAIHVLNDKEIVSYRNLSRALKVHVNLAKQMLWDFHHRQNTKKPGSVHATYLLSGQRRLTTPRPSQSTDEDGDKDSMMMSSPTLPSSSMPMPDDAEPTTKTMLLVKEEHVEKARAEFTQLSGIHIYSLEAEGLSDFQALTECTRKVFALLRTEDPLKTGSQYGTIQNKFVTRRTRTTPMIANTIPEKPTVIKSDEKLKIESKAKPDAKTAPQKAAPAKTATLKRQGSSIAASFAKTAPPKAKASPEPKQDEDTPMAGLSDEEPEDEDEELEVKAGEGKSKQDRQAELEAMMDVDDEPLDEPDDIKEAEAETPEEIAKDEPVESVTVENGRRRGRRRVLKKKTAKDADGYLVTKEEHVWESFSEDEPAPKKAKTALPASASSGKKAAKAGQGNIMSFFSKK